MKLVNVPLCLSNIIKLQSKTAFGSNIFKEMHVMSTSTSDKEDRFESCHEDLIQVLEGCGQNEAVKSVSRTLGQGRKKSMKKTRRKRKKQ